MKLRTVSVARITVTTIGLMAASVLLAALIQIGRPLSIVAGAVFMLADFHLIRMLVSRLIAPGMSQGWTVLLLTTKFLLVVALVAGVMLQFPVEPMSFAVGASTLLGAVVVDACLLGDPVKLDGPTSANVGTR